MTDVSPNLFVGNPLCDKCLGHHPMNWDCQADKPSLIPTPVSPETKARELLPCPFCGNQLRRSPAKINPSARCVTEGCYGAKMPVVNLDVPADVAAWNRRAGYSAALAAPLTDYEHTEVARVIAEVYRNRGPAPYAAAERAIARFVQLRTANGEKKL
jgi:hypothetical protein